MPVRVDGLDSLSSRWNQMCKTRDISPFGASFTFDDRIERGRILLLTLPMPQQMRSYDFLESQYKVWSVVTNCIRDENEAAGFVVGVAFVGKDPPPSFRENPSQVYDIVYEGDNETPILKPKEKTDPTGKRDKVDRQHSRYDIPINVVIEIQDPAGNVLLSEQAVTENVSLGGASIFTSLSPEVGSPVRVKSEQYGADLEAIVRGKRTGKDGIPRLHVEFKNELFPLEGIESEH